MQDNIYIYIHIYTYMLQHTYLAPHFTTPASIWCHNHTSISLNKKPPLQHRYLPPHFSTDAQTHVTTTPQSHTIPSHLRNTDTNLLTPQHLHQTRVTNTSLSLCLI